MSSQATSGLAVSRSRALRRTRDTRRPAQEDEPHLAHRRVGVPHRVQRDGRRLPHGVAVRARRDRRERHRRRAEPRPRRADTPGGTERGATPDRVRAGRSARRCDHPPGGQVAGASSRPPHRPAGRPGSVRVGAPGSASSDRVPTTAVIAPSTPPPPSNVAFAAFTHRVGVLFVMSPSTSLDPRHPAIVGRCSPGGLSRDRLSRREPVDRQAVRGRSTASRATSIGRSGLVATAGGKGLNVARAAHVARRRGDRGQLCCAGMPGNGSRSSSPPRGVRGSSCGRTARTVRRCRSRTANRVG